MADDVTEVKGNSRAIESIIEDCKRLRFSLASIYSQTVCMMNAHGLNEMDLKHLKWAENFCFSLLQETRYHCKL